MRDFRNIRLLLPAFLLYASAAAASPSFWAQTTFIRGEVSAVTADVECSTVLKLGDILHLGDRVTVPERGKATFLLSSGKILVLTVGEHTLSDTAGSEKKSPSLFVVAKNLTRTLLAREGNNPMMKHLGGLRAIEKNLALAPTHTHIRITETRFAWLPSPPVKRFTFTLMGPDDLFLEKAVSGTTLDLPGDKLKSGTTYYWEIRDASTPNAFTSLGSGTFTTLDADTEKKISELERNLEEAFIGDTSDEMMPRLFLQYQIYREHGLNLDALMTLRSMIQIDPENRDLVFWRGELARLVGLEEDDLRHISSP